MKTLTSPTSLSQLWTYLGSSHKLRDTGVTLRTSNFSPSLTQELRVVQALPKTRSMGQEVELL